MIDSKCFSNNNHCFPIKQLHIVLLVVISCAYYQNLNAQDNISNSQTESVEKVSLIVLGTVQDAGSPQIACKKDCCKAQFKNRTKPRKVVSLGLTDAENKVNYLFEATPDITSQMRALSEFNKRKSDEVPDGIFLTHAHIGHYTGLMYFGKEALNAKNVPVFSMSKMKKFLTNNGPWNQLVENQNILLQELVHDKMVDLTSNINVIPFIVPHRDEYSETVGYKIIGPNKKALFIPDIDKWEKWDQHIIDEISMVDYAFIDATFYDGEEIDHRDISEIPHPFIIESMSLFSKLPEREKNKVYFIHMNHTNPALDPNSEQSKLIKKNGFQIARMNDRFEL